MRDFKDIREYVNDKLDDIAYRIEETPIVRPGSSMKGNVDLVVIQIGDDPSSNSYIRGKQKDCERVGINLNWIKIDPETNNTQDVIATIQNWSWRLSCGGIIVQLPIPKQFDLEQIRDAIPTGLDVDGFKKESRFNPCTPKGIIDYLDYCNYTLTGRNALVIGRSDTVGRPLAEMLLDHDATVTVAHSKSDDIRMYIDNADIIFTAINRIEWLEGWMFNNSHADVIDIGLGRGDDGKLHGNLSKKAIETIRCKGDLVISGTGGVGLLTRLALLENVCDVMGI